MVATAIDTDHKEGKVFGAELGFFSKPVYFGESQVLKKYNLYLNFDEARMLIACHDSFIGTLGKIGVNIPETSIYPVKNGRRFSVEIMQRRYEPEELAGEVVKRGHKEEVINVQRSILGDALKFLNSGLNGRMGFHPSVRNYAFVNGEGHYMDTFPPYMDECFTRRLMVRAAPTILAKAAMVAVYPFLNKYTDEYYDPVQMIAGVPGTISRLRPDLSSVVIDDAVDVVDSSKLEGKRKVIEAIRNVSSRGRVRWQIAHLFY